MKRTLILLVFVFFFVEGASANSKVFQGVVPTPSLQAEDVKILKHINFMSPSAVIGGTCTPGSISMTAAYVLVFCNSSSQWAYLKDIWTQVGDNIYLTDTSNPKQKKIGIGTSTPDYKLHLDEDGGILAEGTFGDGVTETARGAGTRLLWYPKKSIFRAGTVTGTDWDNANMGDYTTGFGSDNEIKSHYSSILGGHDNKILFINAYDESSTIVAGEDNVIKQAWAFIGAGKRNSIGNSTGGYSSAIVAGDDNEILGQGIQSFIGAGFQNKAGSGDGVVAGYKNYVNSGLWSTGSFIGAGSNNRIENGVASSAIVAGDNNNIKHHRSFIGGGTNNVHDALPYIAEYQTIVGGYQNRTSASTNFKGFAFIGGGSTNLASGHYTAIPGGLTNTASGDYASVLGGESNVASGVHASVVGGKSNVADGGFSVATGGEGNNAAGDHSWVGGRNMLLDPLADRTFLWGHNATPVTVATPDAFIVYSGNVGIGTITPNDKMDVVGDVDLTGCIKFNENLHFGTCVSDRSTKKNIRSLKGSLDRLAQLDPVSYEYIDEKHGVGKQIGLVAQEVEEVFPSWVVKGEEHKKILYGMQIQMHMIQAIKELNASLDELKEENVQLKKRVNELESLNNF